MHSQSRNIEVIATTDRYGFDGETGVVVLKGTPGVVEALTLKPNYQKGRPPTPELSVYWQAALVQGKGNDEPTVVEDWMEGGVLPAEVRYVRLEPTVLLLHEDQEVQDGLVRE